MTTSSLLAAVWIHADASAVLSKRKKANTVPVLLCLVLLFDLIDLLRKSQGFSGISRPQFENCCLWGMAELQDRKRLSPGMIS